jgi:inner membrane protein YidH
MARPGNEAARFEVRTTAESHFSWIRTRLSLERTLMSWTRTAVSLIGFGFTIVQFFERMQQAPGVAAARFPEAPRYFGLALILCGVIALIVAVWQYHWSLHYLWDESFSAIAGATKEGVQTPLYVVAIALIFVGAAAFLSVLLRLI